MKNLTKMGRVFFPSSIARKGLYSTAVHVTLHPLPTAFPAAPSSADGASW